MLSNKMTFSLTCFVVLIAFGLVYSVPSVFADGRNDDNDGTVYDLTVEIFAAESMIDVSAVDHPDIDDIQIATGRDRASRVIHNAGEAATVDPSTLTISLLVKFSHVVNLAEPGARIPLEDIDETIKNEPKPSGGDFGADDLYVAAYDKEGRSLGVLSLAEASAAGTSISQFRDTGGPGKLFLVRIDESQLRNAYIGRGVASGYEVSSLVFFIPRGTGNKPWETDEKATVDATVSRGIRRYDRAHAIAHFAPKAHQHLNNASNEFQVDLVDDDQGDPEYAALTGPTSAQDVAQNGLPPNDAPATNRGSGTPGVVSVMRTVDRAGFIESGPFDVRIILTEDPMGGLAGKIMVENGTVMSVVKGASYKGGHPERAGIPAYIPADTTVTPNLPAIPLPAVSKMDSELGPSVVEYYYVVADTTADDLAAGDLTQTAGSDAGIARLTATGTVDATGTAASFPQATGRDNMYHSYIARISPNAGLTDDMVTVSVTAFDDNVYPVPNRYVPLTPEQRAATTLSGWAKAVRDARVKNESLSVRVSTAAAGKSLADLAKDAYDARQKELDAIGNEISLANKAYIPAGGYLVLVADAGKAGVNASSAKIAEKLTAAQKLYNTQGLGLPFPGDDLSNFFRNGGTLNLAYKDIPQATGSGHDDSKGAPEKKDGKDNADYTGYTKANSTAYPAGTLLISEIMWGLDGATTDSQYIELHNPGTTAIGIDNKEWVLTVGGAPTGWTVIDTIGNNPASVRWQVPGSDGVSKVEPDAGFFSLVDLVSMSRISDAAGTLAADGTAEASWAASMRPSANLKGRRIGTPGAANVYVEPAAPTPPPTPTPTPPTPAAEVGDLQITEVMVSTGVSGLLPQWIEISNMSGATVSLRGWSINVDNDPGDATVAPSLNIILGDVDVGKDQAVLVVSKMSNRNSGVGTTAGMIRADRIIDAKVGDGDAILSKMAFRIGLVPPLKAGAAGRGDVAGNLQQGWELPMAEGNARSSLIRRAMTTKGEVMGTDAAGWTLAENADGHLSAVPYETYYGDANDMGSPGLSSAGGALPVELSKFGAKRDPLTGQVTVTWETQSELNNAGFFIKRAQQKTAQFVPVNPTMIPGAGTTSEKQTYTYTDTTAQPNIVYYYQIEDVSLDGNRQTLTRAHRLKGHVGAAGKLTTLWGQLKDRE